MLADASRADGKRFAFLSAVLSLIVCAVQCARDAASDNLLQVQGLDNLYLHRKDNLVIDLDDSIVGHGGPIEVHSGSPNIVIEPQMVNLTNLVHSTSGCHTPIKSIDEDEAIYLICSSNIVLRVNLTSSQETILNLEAEGEENLYCQDSVYIEESNRVVVGCVTKLDINRTIKLFVVDLVTMKVLTEYTDQRTFAEANNGNTSSQLNMRAINTTLVLYPTKNIVCFRVYELDEEGIVFKGYFENMANLTTEFSNSETCMINGIEPSKDFVYISVHCSTSQVNYYMRCALSGPNFQKMYYKCDDHTFDEKGVSRRNDRVHLMRRNANCRSASGDLLYYFRLDSLVLIDFNKKVKLPPYFVFKDIQIQNPKAYKIKAANYYNRNFYVVVDNLVERKIELLGVSVAKKYYRRSLIFQYKNEEESKAIYVLLSAENLSKSKLETMIIYNSLTRGIMVLRVLSIMTMKIQFSTMYDVLGLPAPEGGCGTGLCSAPQFKFGSWSSKSSPKKQGSSLIVVPVSIDISRSDSSNFTHHFNLNVLADETESAEINIPRQFFFYEGEVPNTLPISKQLIQAYGPNLTITGDDSELFSVKYVHKLMMEYTNGTLPLAPETVFHLDESLFSLIKDGVLTIYEFIPLEATVSAKYHLHYKIDFVEGELFQDAICFKGLITVITSVSKKKLKLYRIRRATWSMSQIEWNINVELATVNNFETRIEIDIMNKNDKGEWELFYIKFPPTYLNNLPTEFTKYQFLPTGLCPTVIEWASRRLPYLFVESNCGGTFEIVELFLEAERELESPIKSYVINSTVEKVKACAFDKYVVVVESSPKINIYGIDRSFNLANMKKYFPVSEYGVFRVINSHCDHMNPYVVALLETLEQKMIIIVYRIEESGDSALRRVHSVIDTGLSSPGGNFAVVKSHTNPDGVNGYITLFLHNQMISYEFKLAAPEIIMNTSTSKLSINVKLAVSAHGGTKEQSAWANTSIEIVSQNFEPDLQVVGLIGDTEKTTLVLDDYLRVNGLFLEARLESAQGLEAAGIESFLERKMLKRDANITRPDYLLGRMVIHKNLGFTWNSSQFAFFVAGRQVISGNKNITIAKFMNDKSKYEDRTNLSTFVFALSHNVETQKSEAVIVWMNGDGRWNSSSIEIESGISYLKGMLVSNCVFGYVGLHIPDNAIIAGQIRLDRSDQSLSKYGESSKIRMIDNIELFDAFTAGPSMFAILKKRLNDIGSLFEFKRDDLFDKIVSSPGVDMELFPRVPNQFVDPKLRCVSKYSFENHTYEGLCFLYSKGVQSYASKVVLAANQHQRSRTYLIGKFTNLQGFNSRISAVNSDYVAFIAEKTGLSAINHDFVILVYKIHPDHSMPFLILTPTMLGLTKEHLHSLDTGIGLGEELEPLLFVSCNHKNGTNSVQIFNIGTMKMNLKPGAVNKWQKNDILVMEFLGANGESIKRKVALGNLIGGQEFFNGTVNKSIVYGITVGLILVLTVLVVLAAKLISRMSLCRSKNTLGISSVSEEESPDLANLTLPTAAGDEYMQITSHHDIHKPALIERPSIDSTIARYSVSERSQPGHQGGSTDSEASESRFGATSYVIPARKLKGRVYVPANR